MLLVVVAFSLVGEEDLEFFPESAHCRWSFWLFGFCGFRFWLWFFGGCFGFFGLLEAEEVLCGFFCYFAYAVFFACQEQSVEGVQAVRFAHLYAEGDGDVLWQSFSCVYVDFVSEWFCECFEEVWYACSSACQDDA